MFFRRAREFERRTLRNVSTDLQLVVRHRHVPTAALVTEELEGREQRALRSLAKDGDVVFTVADKNGVRRPRVGLVTHQVGPRSPQVDRAATPVIPGSRRFLDHRHRLPGHQGDIGNQFVGRVTFCRRFAIGNHNPLDRLIGLHIDRRFSPVSGCRAQNGQECHRAGCHQSIHVSGGFFHFFCSQNRERFSFSPGNPKSLLPPFPRRPTSPRSHGN